MKKRIVMMMLACAALVGHAQYSDPMAHDVESDGIYYKIVNDEYLSVSPRDSIDYAMADCICPPHGGYSYRTRHELYYSGDVVIPDSVYVEQLGRRLPVKKLGLFAFALCPDLTSVTVLGELDDIEDCAFDYTLKLKRVDLKFSDKFWRIPTALCMYCKSLKEFEIPETVTSIQGTPFFNSGIEQIVLPAGLTDIYDFEYAFGDSPNLKSVTCMNPDPSSINISMWHYSEGYGWFHFDEQYKMAEGCVLYVPEESVELYRADVRWQCFSEIRAIGDVAELPEVGAAAECDDEILYDLLGRPISAPQPGQVVIRRGAKTVIR